jgi:hypothetical protein
MTTKVSHAHAHSALTSAFRNAGMTAVQTIELIKALDHYMLAGFGHVAVEEKAEADAAKEHAKAEAKAEKEHARHG